MAFDTRNTFLQYTIGELSDLTTSEKGTIIGAINELNAGKEDVDNKVTSISASSTDDEYPSAKCMYTIIGDIESIINTIRGV